MTRIKLVLLCLLVVLAFSAVAATSASALSWKVESKALAEKSTEALKEATTLTKSIVFITLGLEVACTKLTVKKGLIEGPAGGNAEAMVYTACTVPSAINSCEVEKKEVKTKAVTAKLEAGVKVAFIPKVGEEYTTLKIINKGEEICEAKGEYKVTGSVVAEMSKAGTEAKEQPFTFTTTSGSTLKVAGKAATFTGEAQMTLGSGKIWGAS